MQIEKVCCLVKVSNDGKSGALSEVPRAGVDAVSVVEVPLLQALHGRDAVSRVYSAGFFEADKRDELARLAAMYPEDLFNVIYPGINAPIPSKIDHLDLPAALLYNNKPVAPAQVAEQVAAVEAADDEQAAFAKNTEIEQLKAQLAAADAEKAALQSVIDAQSEPEDEEAEFDLETKEGCRAAMKAAGMEIPLGNFSLKSLQDMLAKGD